LVNLSDSLDSPVPKDDSQVVGLFRFPSDLSDALTSGVLFVKFPGGDHWIRRSRAVLSLLSLLCVLANGREALSQNAFSQWALRPANSASSRVQSGPQFDFDAGHDEQEDAGEMPLTTSPVEWTAYQNQYPLSGDSSDLLPDERFLNREVSDEAAMAEVVPPASDQLFEEQTEQPWIIWKKTTSTGTWIAPKDKEGLGISTLEVRGSIEFPEFPAVWFVPRFGWNWLNGPLTDELPSQLYDFSFEAVVAFPVGERLIVQTAIAPSLFSDLDNTSSDAFRLPRRLLAFWKCSDRLTLAGGVFYLDRDDVKWLPVGGVLWNPTDDLKFELMAPRPRIAWRTSHSENHESWLYLVGEFGGGTWAIRRVAGVEDVVTLQDYRAMVGFERKTTTVRSWWLEAGYVFNRRIEFTSKDGDSDLASSVLARLGLSF
jgi:hypothetical protein